MNPHKANGPYPPFKWSATWAIMALALVTLSPLHAAPSDPWPPISREQRPWAYWWWMGSAVDQTNLSRELTRYQEAGYGGVHIIPIYGAKGWEDSFIPYLSPRWMEMLRFTVEEANRLDLGVDMTTGSGWCFGGGPNVTEAEGNASVVVKSVNLAGGTSVPEKFDPKKLQALLAFSTTGEFVDLTSKLRPDGSLDWTPRDRDWSLYAISQRFSGQKVKRASPGGEGPMLNLLHPEAMTKFLHGFTEAFTQYQGPKPRAQYHDSYEYKSDWSPVLFEQFEKRRGYQLQHELPALFAGRPGATNAVAHDPNRTARVLCDYRETVSDIIHDDSLAQWVKWSHDRGFLTRNEAHGSPGNLLDLYALADVPETEMFRADRSKLVSKFASSAAHVAGRKLVGSETGTWLKEHFTETLAEMKWLVDDLFLSGVNHVFYHGTCYSPDEAGWPGWLFYASYEMNPRNAVWRDARALNDYVARCQAILQQGKPDNDILLYWPIHDFWSQPGKTLLPHLTVHARDWFEAQPLGKLAERLWARGYQFDYISDRQLAAAKSSKGAIQLPGASYRAIVVPPCEHMPLPTLEKLLALAKTGASILFAEHLPKEVPGWSHLTTRHAAFQERLVELRRHASVGDPETLLAKKEIPREEMVDHEGLFCIRRTSDRGRDYFIANRGDRTIDGWVPLARGANRVVLMDPASGKYGRGTVRKRNHRVEALLQLAPGQSVIVRANTREAANLAPWPYTHVAGLPVELASQWQVEFLSGGPTLPATFSTTRLSSWADSTDPAAQCFSGTAQYTASFEAPATDSAKPALLDLGQVVQSARIRLNGKDYGTLITPPFRVVVDNLKPAGNRIEVEVTSTSANRIRDLDRRGVKWKNFHDINFVNQDYRPFDAANWPVASAGLIGPVTLTPLR